MAPKLTVYARNERGKLVKRSFPTQAEADDWQKEMKDRRIAIRSGNRVGHLASITMGEYVPYWLKKLVKKGRTISTVDDYARKLKLHVLRYFNDKEMRSLEQKDFDLLFEHIQEHHGLDNATRNRIRSILLRLFQDAIQDKIVKVNPIQLTETKKENPSKVHQIWSKEQCEAYLAGAHAWRWDFYVLAQCFLNIGGRKGEVIALQWKHVDLNRGAIRIEQIFEQASKSIVQRTKSDGLKTEVKPKFAGISPALAEVLKSHRKRSAFTSKEDFVNVTENGTPFPPRLVNSLHTRLCARLGLPHCRVHDLRHVVGTLLYRELGDMKAVQQQLGHSDLSTTQRYVHLGQDDAATSMGRFKTFAHIADSDAQASDTQTDTFKKLTPKKKKRKV